MRALAFANDTYERQVGTCQGARYVFDYLKALGVQAFAIEDHYIDRHYLNDYANYYAKSFRPPDPHCKRLHFFDELGREQLDTLLEQAIVATPDGRSAANKGLQAHHKGFLVARPLADARIGRTVLKPYPVEGRRRYEVVRPYAVNLAGVLHLSVNGLAFQQQHRGAAVCASTSLWTALQRVAIVSGHRTPTPTAITVAARSPYPASDGLTRWRGREVAEPEAPTSSGVSSVVLGRSA